jgi:hypothetical protein
MYASVTHPVEPRHRFPQRRKRPFVPRDTVVRLEYAHCGGMDMLLRHSGDVRLHLRLEVFLVLVGHGELEFTCSRVLNCLRGANSGM